MHSISRKVQAMLPDGRNTFWDINNGHCYVWANLAKARFGGELVHFQVKDPGLRYHCFLLLRGKYYDAFHPEGIDCPLDSLFVSGVTRREWLQSQPVPEQNHAA